jgi:TonB-linked SusC/RagA family outer membrane protein
MAVHAVPAAPVAARALRCSLRRWCWPARPELRAQAGVSGRVIDQTGRPVAGAQIQIQGTQIGSLTDARGQFQFQSLPAAEVTLRVVMIGFREVTRVVRSGQTDIVIDLQERALALDEIIVTGTAGEQQARAVGNAVGRLQVSELQQLAPAQNVQRVLSAQVPGVRIMATGGEVGTGGVSRIRGVSSLTLAATPLVYVDGVRVYGADNSAALGGVGFRITQQPSRINDINPEDIESIEVIKGPAAATLYGTEAANGVIQIITKKGRGGAPRINVTMKQGANWYPDVYNIFPETYYRCTGVSRDPSKNVPSALQCNPGEITAVNVLKIDRDVYGNEWFRTGHVQGYGAEISGGGQQVSYFASANLDKDQGALPYNFYDRLSGRANIGYTPSDRFGVDLSLGMVRGRGQSASTQQPLSTAIIWACPAPGCEAGSGLPNALDGPFRGYIAYLPEVYQNEIEGFQELDRTTVGVTAQHRPFPWFNHRLVVGGDFTGTRNADLWRATGSLGNFQPQGRRRVVNLRTSYSSIDYGANLSVTPMPDLTLTTSGGAQYYRRMEQSTFAQGENFPVVSLETVTSGSSRTATEDFFENKTFGLYIQEQIAWRNQLFLTGAIRGDDNSAFGENFEFVVYPKISASWVISEQPFMERLGFVSDLKLRAAWGRAGQQPDVFDALRTYQPTIGLGGAVVTPENLGNPDLQPEVGEELELGFDASVLNDRVGLEFTLYRQRTLDAIVRVPTIPSLGFPGVQFRNIGEVRNRGIELGVRAQAYRSSSLGVDFTVTLSSSKNEVVDLGGQPPIVQSAGNGQYHAEGFPLGGIFLRRVVSADLTQVGGRNVATNVLCEGGEVIPGTRLSRGGGRPVPCAQAPDVYWGQPVPEWEGGFSTTITIGRNLQLYGLADFIRGRTLINGDVGAVHRFFLNSRAILERTDPILLGYETLGGAGVWQTGIHKGDFAKLRTLSATYTLPDDWTDRFGASRISVTAALDNVATLWQGAKEVFGHRVMDVERTNQIGGATPGLNAYHQEGWPQLRRFVTTLRVAF